MKNTEKMVTWDSRVKISTLWIVVMLNMIFADILSFMLPSFLEILETGNAEGVPITKEILLVFAVILEIPIVMIFLSRVLKAGINRWVNIVAAVITIAFVVGGGSLEPHYLFFAAVEVICMIFIIITAWNLPRMKARA